ncbi:MAG: hypothetical protein HC899_22875 [Leptolyngbyaceae cyanobacterium SM1_4_3]|nr:hypothetical protein [Leptolyngbyaceae cyanobacterium SM1_4_3]
MAVSISASEAGLQIVDHARRKKGWTKYEEAWYQIALTSRATLKRFWAREAIRQEIFIAICQVVGIEDWETIADFSSQTLEDRQFFFSGSLQPTILDGSITQEEVRGVLEIFASRDDSVRNKNVEGFLGTQLNAQEIKKGASKGYLSCSNMTTTVLQVGLAKDREINQDMCAPATFLNDSCVDYAVEVREDYENGGKSTHSAYLTYFVSKTDTGFRIVQLRSKEDK